MQQRTWQVNRTLAEHPDGQRRWDRAYQLVLRWAPEPTLSADSIRCEEDAHAYRPCQRHARVSTSHQQQTQTIVQQVTRLRSYVTTQALWSLSEEHSYCDDGHSGAKLKRRGLDQLRDQAAQGAFDLILLTAPDRLARNYVHQMVLLEEFAQAGCQVQCLDRPLSDDPHDQLLLQIRGAVAEYERTLITERMRRGRLAKVRNGQLLPWTRAPYGYRMHPERPRDPALLTIDEAQAAIVQELFHRYAAGTVSLYKLALDLTQRGLRSPQGAAHWTAATIRLILLNPCYTGTAYANRTQSRPATRRKSPLQPVGPGASWSFAPSEEWIPVAVPAIISQELFERVQARLKTNQQTARRNTRHDYLLRTLVYCGHCHLCCYGHFRAPHYFYYKCRAKLNAVRSCRDERCPGRWLPADQLDTLVWHDLCTVLQHPELIALAMERAHSGAWLPEHIQQRQGSLQRALGSVDRQRDRLLAAYLAEAIELPEFERRQRELVKQRDDLQGQLRHPAHISSQLQYVRKTIPTIQALCERLRDGLDQATFEQKRQLVELLIDCVIVTDEQVEIRYVIPTTEASTHIRFCHLRKDYFDGPTHYVLRP